MVLRVIGQVAPLAQVAQVGQVAVLRHMVKVRRGEHDLAAGLRVRFSIDRAAFRERWSALAAVAGSLAHLRHLCQRCHLTYDAQHHAQTAYATRRARANTMEMDL